MKRRGWRGGAEGGRGGDFEEEGTEGAGEGAAAEEVEAWDD